MTARKVLVATAAFWYHDDDDNPTLVPAGARVRAGHPMLKGREDLFREDSEVDFDYEDPDAPTHRGPGRPRKS